MMLVHSNNYFENSDPRECVPSRPNLLSNEKLEGGKQRQVSTFWSRPKILVALAHGNLKVKSLIVGVLASPATLARPACGGI